MEFTRKDRVLSTLKKVVADFLKEEAGPSLLITVTNISISKDYKYCTVYVSVFPEKEERGVLENLEKRKKDLRNFVKIHTRLKRLPFFDVKVDKGEKSRQKIDAIAQNDKLE